MQRILAELGLAGLSYRLILLRFVVIYSASPDAAGKNRADLDVIQFDRNGDPEYGLHSWGVTCRKASSPVTPSKAAILISIPRAAYFRRVCGTVTNK